MVRMGPLSGVKVVELAGIGPAPFACMMLAELGAEVLRIERPGGGLALGPPELELLNRGRRNVALNLKDPAAIDTVLQLVAGADVLIEGFRPGVAERLGLGPDDCQAVNPKLVYGRMTGWGQDGPLAQSAGHDIDYLALSGALHLIGRAGGPPQVPVNLLGDFAGGSLYLVVGVLAALVEARGSGQGQVVDAAIVDGAAHLTTLIHGALAGGNWKPERGTNLLDTGAPFYDVYETSDGEFMAVGADPPARSRGTRSLRLGDLACAAQAPYRDLHPAHAGRVDRDLRRHRRLCLTRTTAGRRPPASRCPRHLRRQGRRPAAGTRAALLSHHYATRPAAGPPGPAHPRSPGGLGCDRDRCPA